VKTEDEAPLPPRTGLMRHVYETVDSLGGANLDQIKQYLPAALLNGETMPTGKQLQAVMLNSVYHGYLRRMPDRDGVKYWRVADTEYYQTVHGRRLSMSRKSKRRTKARKQYRASHPKPTTQNSTTNVIKANSVLWAMDVAIKVLSAEERVIHNKIDRLRKMRTKLVDIGI